LGRTALGAYTAYGAGARRRDAAFYGHLALTSVKRHTDQLEMTPWRRCSESFKVPDKQLVAGDSFSHSSSRTTGRGRIDHLVIQPILFNGPVLARCETIDNRSNHYARTVLTIAEESF
jgi:hypothetical protein